MVGGRDRPGGTIGERSREMEEAKRKRIELLRKEKEDEETNFSFKPDLSHGKDRNRLDSNASFMSAKSRISAPTSVPKRPTSSSAGSNNLTDLSFHERQEKMAADKEQRIRLAQERERHRKAEECNFQPKITSKSQVMVKKVRDRQVNDLVKMVTDNYGTVDPDEAKKVVTAISGKAGQRLNLQAKIQNEKKKKMINEADQVRSTVFTAFV